MSDDSGILDLAPSLLTCMGLYHPATLLLKATSSFPSTREIPLPLEPTRLPDGSQGSRQSLEGIFSVPHRIQKDPERFGWVLLRVLPTHR